jgi:hypothetical protein
VSLDETALNIGRQLVRHAVTEWLDVRSEKAQRGRDLTEADLSDRALFAATAIP